MLPNAEAIFSEKTPSCKEMASRQHNKKEENNQIKSGAGVEHVFGFMEQSMNK